MKNPWGWIKRKLAERAIKLAVDRLFEGKMAGYKTIVFNVLSLVALLFGAPELAALGLGPELIAKVILVVNIALRFFTSTPVFTPKE